MVIRCILALVLLSGTAAAGESPPPPELRWSKSPNALTLRIVPEDGTHLTPALPVVATIDDGGAFRVTWKEPEVPEVGPLKLVLPRVASEGSDGWAVRVEGGVCTLDSSMCLPWHAAFDVPRRGAGRGKLVAERGRPEAPAAPAAPDAGEALEERHGAWHEARSGRDIAQAFAQAQQLGRPLLIDFFAQWCPPCDRLRDEFLHDPSRADELARFVLLRADADRPATFGLKDRFRVGGYPTVLLVTWEGTVLDRIVGYEGPDAFGRRLAGVVSSSDEDLLAQLAAAPAGGAEATRLSVLLSRRAEGEGDPARAWELLAPVRDRLDPEEARRAAALGLEAGAAQARGFALAVAEKDPLPGVGLADALAQALKKAGEADEAKALLERWSNSLAEQPWGEPGEGPGGSLGRISGHDVGTQERLGEAGWYLATWAEDGREDFALGALHYAAWLLLDAGLAPEGDPWEVRLEPLLDPNYLDRHEGRIHDLLDLLEHAGRYEDALRFYAPMIALRPGSFTWPHRLAGHYAARDLWEEALAPAEQAVANSYGDNHLRAVQRQAEILLHLDRAVDAIAALDAALSAAPPDVEHVRTHRYLERLTALRRRAVAAAAPPK